MPKSLTWYVLVICYTDNEFKTREERVIEHGTSMVCRFILTRLVRSTSERLELLGNFLAHACPTCVFNGDRLLWLAVLSVYAHDVIGADVEQTRTTNVGMYGVNENVFRTSSKTVERDEKIKQFHASISVMQITGEWNKYFRFCFIYVANYCCGYMQN